MKKDIVYEFCKYSNTIRKQFINAMGYGQPNKCFTEWFNQIYSKTNGVAIFKNLRTHFYALSFDEQIECLCNIYTIKPILHELCLHDELDYSINDKEFKLEPTWALKYGGTFTALELLDCWENDIIIRSDNEFCFGKWNINYGLKVWSRINFRKYLFDCIVKCKPIQMQKLAFDIPKFLKTKNMFYLLNKKTLEPTITESVLNSRKGITYSPCAYTEGPFIEIKKGQLPFDELMDLKIDFTKLSLEERKEIVIDNFGVEMYEC